jgi:stress response protein SCP2
VTSDGRVPNYQSFVYYRNRRSLDTAVSHRGDSGPGGTFEDIDVDLSAVERGIDRIIFALALYQPDQQPRLGLSVLGPLSVSIFNGTDARQLGQYPILEKFAATHTGATIAELVRLGADAWTFSVGVKPYDAGLVGIASEHGIELA